MVKAWYMIEPAHNQFDSNQLVPPQPVFLDELERKTGIICRKVRSSYAGTLDHPHNEFMGKVEVDSERQNDILDAVPQAVACQYRDTIEVSEARLGNEFEKKLAIFFDEHLHTDDEVRFILDGTGYFDVRDETDRWIRIAVEKGDFIILPAGIYHRFTVDEKKYLKAMRLFAGVPVWTPHTRNSQTDELPQRQEYMGKLERV